MKQFMGKSFLLENEIAEKLYEEYAKDMPIFDYHCHLSAKEIFEDRQFSSIGSLWLGGDHYKWRLMRAKGIAEKYITGTASDYEKFIAFADMLPYAIGNPVYHWSHLELRQYFGITDVLDAKSAPEIWKEANIIIEKRNLSPRKMIIDSRVKTLCTTEDPCNDLHWHDLLKSDFSQCKVLPAWRPDRALWPDKKSYCVFISELGGLTSLKIDSYRMLKNALCQRMDSFDDLGCVASDHDINKMEYIPCSEETMEGIFVKAIEGKELSEKEYYQYRTELLSFLAGEYSKRGWAMELHIGCNRDQNMQGVLDIGQACGFDSPGDYEVAIGLGAFFNRLEEAKALPKTILFSLNPKDNWILASLANTFQSEGFGSKIQLGAAWWMQDHKEGMEQQLIALANTGLLGDFIGMLTDSRSFLSYSRHDYFRRILCNFIGCLVEKGEYPYTEQLGKIIEGICFENANEYFKKKK
jgi:glucuronate isomerase